MKNDLPYFSHDNNASQHPKMKALIAEYGFEGYGRFWILNEKIARNEGAYIDISRKVYKLDLANELRLDSEGLDKFLSFLSDPEIDLINIKDKKITTDRINELFHKAMEKRENQRKPKGKKNENKEIVDDIGKIANENKEIVDDLYTDKIRQDKNREDKNKQELPQQKPIALLSREPKNDIERVNKKWLENYIALHGNQPVNLNWDITTPLVSKSIKQVGVAKTLQALETAMKDDFCINSGYILKVIMSSNVISRLINQPRPPPGHSIANDNIPPEDAEKYFRRQ